MNMGKWVSAGLIAVLLLQGCSAFQPKQQSVTIIASVQGATVYVDNNPVGTTPVTMMLDRNKSYAVSAQYGGRHGTAVIDRKISGTGVLDIVGTCLFIIPVIGLFCPGFWDLDPTTVQVQIPQ
jgi:PEGA domain